MNILAVFNEHELEPTGYTDRETVKAVIINDNDEVLLISESLPGGGVEVGETHQEALHRELMEEIGAIVRVDRELGNVITYRDELHKKYIFTGYECSLISMTTPTTTIDHEIGLSIGWEKRIDAIDRMEKYVIEVQTKGREVFEGDRYQRHLFNTQAAIAFLKEIKR